MSTTPGSASPVASSGRAARPAERALFSRLIDDAAVFPPGLAPLDRAVRQHLSRTRYAALVGPLVIPAIAAGDVAALAAGAEATPPLRVALVARPGSPTGPVRDAVARLAEDAFVEVVGIEVGWSPDWQDLRDLGVPVTVEIPRDGHDSAVADVGRAAREHDSDSGQPMVQAKFRTGATEAWAWPDESELAGFIRRCVDADLRFKLTGGLHHAMRGEPDGGPQHGLLNVLAATRWAVEGASAQRMVSLLSQRDPVDLVPLITGMTTAEATGVRAVFTAYGCCTVTDPIGELAALGLLDKE